MSDRKLEEYVIIVVLVTFLIGEAIIFAFMAISKGDFGSLADWVSGVGALGAIVGVIYQVNEQRIEFQQSKKADIAVALGIITKPVKAIDEKGIATTRQIAQTYCYNTGYSAGSFRFIGFATDDTVENLKNKKPETKEKRIKDPEYETLLCEERKFNRVDSRQTSDYINYDLKLLKRNFDEGDKVYAVYDDPLGNLYFSIGSIPIRKE
jgi:hypothetical protein